MSLYNPSSDFSKSPPLGQYQNQRNSASPPLLPPMSSLLRRNDPRHDPPSPDRTRYQVSPGFAPNPPTWHSEHNADVPPSHSYRPAPSQHQRVHSKPGPHLVPKPLGTTVPVSQQVPLAQYRQVRMISQRRQYSGSEKDESQMFSRPSTRDGSHHHYEQEVTEFKHQDSMSTYSGASSRSTPMPLVSRAMPISGLLSADPSPIRSTTPPKYSIRVRQEPIAARACGFGERDRRVIDPPPILQMMVESPTSTPEEISNMIRSNLSVVHCTLWDPVADKDDTAMPGTTDKRQQRRLMGTLVSSPFVGLDEHDVEGCFFTFPDLSVRTPGTYSLKFALVILDPMNMRPGGSAPIQSTAMSAPFHVYNAKDFAGMRASTALTKRLKNQGCLISVKKGNAKSKNDHGKDDEEDDNDDDDDDEAGFGDLKGKGKRSKR